MIPGVNTFPNAIPTPINIVPTYNQETPALKAIPINIKISAPKLYVLIQIYDLF